MPSLPEPMKAESIENSSAEKVKSKLRELEAQGEWVAETKWDGTRTLAEFSGGRIVQMRSHEGKDYARRFPEVAKALPSAVVGVSSIMMDGEIGFLERSGEKMNFNRLQKRPFVDTAKILTQSVSNPATFFVFDVLSVDGRDVRNEPLRVRRELLEKHIVPSERVRVTPQSKDLVAAYERACFIQSEGIMVKNVRGRYESGAKSGSWLKAKTPLNVDQAWVVGLTQGTGSRSDVFASVVLAKQDENKDWVYLVCAGNGFADAERERVLAAAGRHRVDACPMRVQPDLDRPLLFWVEPGHLECDIVFEQEVAYAPRHPRVKSTKYGGVLV